MNLRPAIGPAFLLTGAITACATGPSSATPRVTSLSWLAGSWSTTVPDGAVVTQVWTEPKNGAMYGTHEQRRDGRLEVSGEFRVLGGANGIVLLGSPDGSEPRSFGMVDWGSAHAEFVDRRADFAQSIRLTRSGSELTVRFAGVDGTGGPRETVYEMTRLPDPPR